VSDAPKTATEVLLPLAMQEAMDSLQHNLMVLTSALKAAFKRENYGCIACLCEHIEQEDNMWQTFRNKDCPYCNLEDAFKRFDRCYKGFQSVENIK
jgi:ferredoxin-thioredoxin reductase catalytic subunit